MSSINLIKSGDAGYVDFTDASIIASKPKEICSEQRGHEGS